MFFVVLLRQRWLVFAAVFSAVMAGAVALVLSLPPRYVADALLAADTRPLRSTLGVVSSGAVPGQDPAASNARVDPAALAGEVNILSSRAMVAKVVERTRLHEDPEFASAGVLSDVLAALKRSLPSGARGDAPDGTREDAEGAIAEEVVKRVSKALSVEVPRGTSQLRVSLRADDPATAAAAVNAFVSIYLDEQAATKRRAAAQTLAELREELDILRGQADAAARAVQAFREEQGLLKSAGPSPGLTPSAQRLNDLVAAEQKAAADARDAAAKLELLRAAGPKSASVSGVNQELYGQLAAQEAEARTTLARATAAFGPQHPSVVEARAQLKQVEDRLASLHALTSTALAGKAAELEGRHRRLAEMLRSAREDLERENAREARLERLVGEARARQAAYEEVFASYNRAAVSARNAVPDMRVLYPAEPAGARPRSKLPLLALAVPLAASLAAAAVLLVHRATSSRRQTAHEFEGWSNVPVIGVCPVIAGARPKNPAGYLGRDPLSEYADAVRGVRNAIDFDRLRAVSIAVTSASIGEGKSTLAVSLATAWAAAGARTLLIDCDMRRPALPKLLACDKNSGLADFLTSKLVEDKLVQTNEHLGFDFIAAGSRASGASFCFTRGVIRGLIDDFSSKYDRIILDLPPVLAVPDAAVGAAASDLVVFVNHWGRTKPDDARSALELLRKLGVTEVRAVLCRVDPRRYAKLESVKRYSSYARAGRYEAQEEA